MRKTLRAAALMLALCCPALAGEIPNPPAPQPQGMTIKEPAMDGEIPTPGVSDSLTVIARDVLAVLPSLL
ncbi:MAG: hypothetical protein QOJ70_1333 [Acidobacteriota bacterium]|jgi:hypothetical protein|nr:hypothetical protein [Acidobacteriota bacterium]